tara:strand:- start:274 stop:1122 length:849 start_codon:yes stop_codon:yes gene_type:complete
MKQLKALLVTLFYIVLLSCSNVKHNPPKLISETFTYLTAHVRVEICGLTKNRKLKCLKLDPLRYRASGSVIKHIKEHSYILTVAHFCNINRDKIIEAATDSVINESFFKSVRNVRVDILIEILDGTGFTRIGKIISTNNLLDICVLETDRINVKAIKLGAVEPVYGETLWNLSSPLGIVVPNSVPILKGIFSGEVNLNAGRKVSVITDLPAVAGMSGSPLINQNGKMVGMVYATIQKFRELSYAVKLKDLREFLNYVFTSSSERPPITGNTTVEVEIDQGGF